MQQSNQAPAGTNIGAGPEEKTLAPTTIATTGVMIRNLALEWVTSGGRDTEANYSGRSGSPQHWVNDCLMIHSPLWAGWPKHVHMIFNIMMGE